MDLVIASVADRPDLADHQPMPDSWVPFVGEDPVANVYYSRARTAFPEFVLLAFAADDLTTPVAKSYSMPFAMGGETQRNVLPDDGWDRVVMWSWLDTLRGTPPTHVCAIEVAVRTDMLGTGLASVMLNAKCQNAAKLGFSELVAPVRPNHKHLHPHMPMGEYVVSV